MGISPEYSPYLGSFTAVPPHSGFPAVRNVSVLTIFWILRIVAPDVVPRGQGDDPGTAMANDPNRGKRNHRL